MAIPSFLRRASKGSQEPPTKRISTPAGQRLSVILENTIVDTSAAKKAARDFRRPSTNKAGVVSNSGIVDVPRDSLEGQSHDSSGHTYSVWSEASNAKLAVLRSHQHMTKKPSRRRLALIVIGVAAVATALIVGLIFGLRNRSSSGYLVTLMIRIEPCSLYLDLGTTRQQTHQQCHQLELTRCPRRLHL